MCRAGWTREQTCYLGAMSPRTSGCFTHKQFTESGRSSAGQRSTSSPQETTLIAQLIFEGQGCVGLRLAQPPPLYFSPDRPDPTGNQANQGTEAQDSVSGPALEEPTLVRRAVSHAPIAGQSVGKNNLVVRFLKESRRLNPPCPITVPTWDLPTVLRALKSPLLEPLQSVDFRPLMLKNRVWEIFRRSLPWIRAWRLQGHPEAKAWLHT